MVDYFSLINACLAELNRKQVKNFDKLESSAHLKLKKIINDANKNICLTIGISSGGFALNSLNTVKPEMEYASDVSIISGVFSDIPIICGACLKFENNPVHAKFAYRLSRYSDAFARLKTAIEEGYPVLRKKNRK